MSYVLLPLMFRMPSTTYDRTFARVLPGHNRSVPIAPVSAYPTVTDIRTLSTTPRHNIPVSPLNRLFDPRIAGLIDLKLNASSIYIIHNGSTSPLNLTADPLKTPRHSPFFGTIGMHSIKERPVVVNGQIVIRPIMVVALTYDHRLLDGREAVTFLGASYFSICGSCFLDS